MNKLAERMQNLLRPFVLRRLKTEVAYQLAPKKHILHKVPMTSEQAELYARAVADLKKDLAPKAGISQALLPCYPLPSPYDPLSPALPV